MKILKILRTAKRLTLMDLQNLTGINAATLSLFENGKVGLDEDQKDRLHKVFPSEDRKRLFADLETDRKYKSIFGPRKLSPQMEARIDAEVKESLRHIDEETEKRNQALRDHAAERAKKFNL